MVGWPEPSPGLFRRIDGVARALLPSILTSVLLVLAAGPSGVPALVPAMGLTSIFFWSIFRPGAVPPPVVFVLGALQDLLTMAPLGLGIITLLLVHGVALAWRRFLARQSFLFVWLVFCGFSAGAAALSWMFTALLGWMVPPLPPALHHAALMAGLYPAVAYLLGRVHAIMMRAEEQG
jgi:rod shape-determining protein MreD